MERELGVRWLSPFLSGVLAGAAGAILTQAFMPRRRFDVHLIRGRVDRSNLLPAVLVPGLLGSELVRPDGSQAWLNVGNALGYHDLTLPVSLPLSESRDELAAGGLLGVDGVLPRLFGYPEHADLLELLDHVGFARDRPATARGASYHVFTYDWRRDIVESARRLHDALEELAEARGDRNARFNLVAHSMGGLVARYYLRYGRAEPGGPVTWAGAARVGTLVVVATPNAGSVTAIDIILNGKRVGLSSSTLAAPVIRSMPAIYQFLPAKGANPLLDHQGEPLEADLFEPETWWRFEWGPFSKRREGRVGEAGHFEDEEAVRAHFAGALARASAFREALDRRPETPCPARVVLVGGDGLPTPARAIVPEAPGSPPRFEPHSPAEAEVLSEAGDGAVTLSSMLASHLPEAETSELDCGIPEVSATFFGDTDHHGVYSEPTFQSLLLRLLLRPPGGPRPR